ncbi:NAD-dependent epimerase/dehydratase family protein [Marixanthomonas ophiurae]|uniref:NAD-dependent epimerase/dehydratase family protein n=2 Tax=Marixanthomonas ophiurae TaxID=387659 RepID=A0A3E1QAX2_9FLAO|nr:NAD-dependent epimerase/dehydratase family protein [Marixanthomonas ophiurae]
MSKTAIILGATGLTGSMLLQQLLDDDSISTIKLFSRSSSNIKSPKVEEYLIDMFQLEKETERFTGDVVFCCIGTTKSKTPDKETYKKIDYGIPVAAAKLAKQNSIKKFVVISALGSNPDSSVFYNKVKGEMERDVLQQNISETYILQPSLIGGDRNENRTGESIAQFFAKTFSFLIPKKYKMIEPETIAKAMQNLLYKPYAKTRIPSDEIKKIATV